MAGNDDKEQKQPNGVLYEPGKDRMARGREAEALAVDFLLQAGYSLVERNWRCRSGEIDAILKDEDGVWVFVEIRSRLNRTGYGEAREAIHTRKQLRVRQLVQWYVSAHGLHEAPIRCDAVAVTFYGDGRKPYIEHFRHAF